MLLNSNGRFVNFFFHHQRSIEIDHQFGATPVWQPNSPTGFQLSFKAFSNNLFADLVFDRMR